MTFGQGQDVPNDDDALVEMYKTQLSAVGNFAVECFRLVKAHDDPRARLMATKAAEAIREMADLLALIGNPLQPMDETFQVRMRQILNVKES